jgi:hypothetical protein
LWNSLKNSKWSANRVVQAQSIQKHSARLIQMESSNLAQKNKMWIQTKFTKCILTSNRH